MEQLQNEYAQLCARIGDFEVAMEELQVKKDSALFKAKGLRIQLDKEQKKLSLKKEPEVTTDAI